ncbi:MAG: LysR substrate-binding domain-containing protein [Pseudomonadota bacterium]
MHTTSTAELRAFEAAARSGSMSGAARLLGISQPTVSAHLLRLEQQFGVELFHRKSRGVELTEFGRLLHEATHRLYQAEEQARLLLLSASCHYEGHLRLCAVGPYNVTPMLRRFRARYGKVRLSVEIGDSRQIVERVRGHRADVGVLLHGVDDADVHCLPYRRQKLLVFAPAGHALAQRAALSLHDLEGQEFVLREDGSRTRKVFEVGLAAAGVRIRCSVEMGSREAVREAVAQGLGLGVVAQSAFFTDPRLVPLAIADMQLFTHVHVICLKERLGSTLITNFLQGVEELKAEAG